MVFLWFDIFCGLTEVFCGLTVFFCVSKNHGQVLFFDGHGVTEGEPQTVNPHTTRQSHKPLATHTQHTQHTTHHQPRPTHHAPQAKPRHTVTGSWKAANRRSTHTPHARATSHQPHETTPHQVTPRQNRPHQEQARPHQARPLGQGQFQFKENVVDASASPVAALLIQGRKGCDKG